MVGSVMAEDLATCEGIDVTLADVDESRLGTVAERSNGAVSIQRVDCSDARAITAAVAPFDVVLGALPSRLGLDALGAVIEAGVSCCDISFMAQDPRCHAEAAEARGITCIVDCGVAPGMSNLLAGRAALMLDPCRRIDIVVGGLPVDRHWPWEYKAAFSPRDVIEEYTRPARIIEDGRIVVREALSEPELLDLPGVGTLEAFNTDGLRTLCDTLAVPDMRERTLRYPGHAEQMRILRASGFFSTAPISVGDVEVTPMDVTAELLFPHWTYEEGEADLTVMRVEAEGMMGDVDMRVRWDLLDHRDATAGHSSMARTTAFPATAMARMILDGTLSQPGVHPPEALAGEDAAVQRLLAELEVRGIAYVRTLEPLR